jgi:hypothetical protein
MIAAFCPYLHQVSSIQHRASAAAPPKVFSGICQAKFRENVNNRKLKAFRWWTWGNAGDNVIIVSGV